MAYFGKGFTSKVLVQGHAGYGSTNIVITIYSTVTVNQGNDITYATSATLGDTFTVNADGIYSIMAVGGRASGNGIQGFTVNSSELNTQVSNLSDLTTLGAYASNGASGTAAIAARTMRLSANDVVRAHSDGNNSNSVDALFVIERVG